MCTTCGCTSFEHDHDHDHDGHHKHEHDHSGHHEHKHDHDHKHAKASTTVKNEDTQRLIEIEKSIFSRNDKFAQENRNCFIQNKILALNLISSPGSGKTTLLCKTIENLLQQTKVGVIEGDQQTDLDAERIKATGVNAIQINTGKGCHLDAHSIGHAFESMALNPGSVLFIENVGNLVCPSEFDLGEAHKVVLLSVTEGEDKPLKYPNIFINSSLMLLTKTDLLPYLQFNVDKCIENARKINPKIQVIKVSSTSGEGLNDWLSWIRFNQ